MENTLVEALGEHMRVRDKEQGQVHTGFDQEVVLELGKVAALAQDMVEEQALVHTRDKEETSVIMYCSYYLFLTSNEMNKNLVYNSLEYHLEQELELGTVEALEQGMVEELDAEPERI